MNFINFNDLPNQKVRVWGALDFDHRSDGMGVRRLPDWTRSQVPEGLETMLRMPSGVRVQFVTDSPKVSLNVLTTSIISNNDQKLKVPFQLQVDEQLHTAYSKQGNRFVSTGEPPNVNLELQRGSAESLIFDDLPKEHKFCEIWLPQNAFVLLRSIEVDEGFTFFDIPNETRKRWVHYGSSISHCMEAKLPSEIWPAVAARKSNLALTNLGFGGQCHLDPFVARTIRDIDCDFISIKVGINIINLNSMKERVFTPLLHGFLDTIREKQQKTPILLISPIFCPSAEDFPGPTIPDEQGKFKTSGKALNDGTMSLKRVREILEMLVDARSSGDENLSYFNGLELFGESDRDDLPDDLHPNPEGYLRMGSRFHEKYLKLHVSS